MSWRRIRGKRFQKLLAVGRNQIHNQPRRLGVASVEHEGLVDEEGTIHVDDDAGFARREQSVAVGLNQSARLVVESGRHLKADIRQINNDAVGIVEGKGADVDLLREVSDEARASMVAGDAGIFGDRHLWAAFRHGRDQSPQDQGKDQANRPKLDAYTTHGRRCSPKGLIQIGFPSFQQRKSGNGRI